MAFFNFAAAALLVLAASGTQPASAHPPGYYYPPAPATASDPDCVSAQPATAPVPAIDNAGAEGTLPASTTDNNAAPAPAPSAAAFLSGGDSGPDYQLALELAQLTDAAYCKRGLRESTCDAKDSLPIAADLGWKIEYESPVISFVATKMLDNGHKLAALVYRGTTPSDLTDIKRGFQAGTEQWVKSYGVQVVPGYILEVQPQQTDALAKICPLDGTCTRIITGHSKGGATAEIAAYKLCFQHPDQCQTAEQVS